LYFFGINFPLPFHFLLIESLKKAFFNSSLTKFYQFIIFFYLFPIEKDAAV